MRPLWWRKGSQESEGEALGLFSQPTPDPLWRRSVLRTPGLPFRMVSAHGLPHLVPWSHPQRRCECLSQMHHLAPLSLPLPGLSSGVTATLTVAAPGSPPPASHLFSGSLWTPRVPPGAKGDGPQFAWLPARSLLALLWSVAPGGTSLRGTTRFSAHLPGNDTSALKSETLSVSSYTTALWFLRGRLVGETG